MYLIYIGIYNITDAVFFVHMLSLTNHGKHCRHPTILTRYGIVWQLTMLSYGISKNIPRAWTLDFPQNAQMSIFFLGELVKKPLKRRKQYHEVTLTEGKTNSENKLILLLRDKCK